MIEAFDDNAFVDRLKKVIDSSVSESIKFYVADMQVPSINAEDAKDAASKALAVSQTALQTVNSLSKTHETYQKELINKLDSVVSDVASMKVDITNVKRKMRWTELIGELFNTKAGWAIVFFFILIGGGVDATSIIANIVGVLLR